VQSSQGQLSHLFLILHFREHWKNIQLESITDFQGMLFLSHGNEDSQRIEDGRVFMKCNFLNFHIKYNGYPPS